MPQFAKNPKVIAGVLIVAWLIYVVYRNYQLAPVEIHLLPFGFILQLRVSTILVGAAIFGSAATLAIQWLWRRRSKNASQSAVAPAASTRTVA
jgi:hypothetical protein